MAKKEKKQSQKGKESQEGNPIPRGYVPRAAKDFRERIVPEMMKQFGYKNIMQVPKLEKIVLNMGIGEASRDAKLLETLRENLETIAGQRAVVTKAKKSISNFKIRQGMPVGCSVTLRGNRMYDFIDRFMNVCVPRIRDFRGLSPRSFDGRGNYAVGIKEQLIFPEIHYDDIPRVQGLDIAIVTTANTDEEAFHMLKLMGMPFRG